MVRHGQTGHLVYRPLPEELAKAMIYVLQNKEYATRIANNAYEFAKLTFSKEQVLKTLQQDICEAVPSYGYRCNFLNL